jgi:hypothetical protein
MKCQLNTKGRHGRGRDRMVVGFQLPMQLVLITTNVASSNSAQAIQHYVIKFVCDLRQVGVFFPVSSTNKIDRHDITEILLKVALNAINQT